MKTHRRPLQAVRIFWIGLAVLLGSGQAWSQDSTATTSTTLAEMQLSPEEYTRWTSLFRRFYSIHRQQEDPAVKRRILDEFLGVDQDAIPPAVRHAYYSTRLNWDHAFRYDWDPRNDHWEDMLAIRDRLMRPREGLKDNLVDADLLYQVASYFSNNVFFPPKGYPVTMESWAAEERFKHWSAKYKNEPETERINQYIVDHFDPEYVVVQKAFAILASSQVMQGKHATALEKYRKFLQTDVDKLYSVSRLTGDGRTISAEAQLSWDKRSVLGSMRHAPQTMASAAAQLEPPEVALAELDALKRQYPDDAKVQEQVNGGLANVTLKRVLERDKAASVPVNEQIRNSVAALDALKAAYPGDAKLAESIERYWGHLYKDVQRMDGATTGTQTAK